MPDTKETVHGAKQETALSPNTRESSPLTKAIGYKALEEISRVESNDEATQMALAKQERLVALLNSEEEIRQDLMRLVVSVLHALVESAHYKANVNVILRRTYKKLLNIHLYNLFNTVPYAELGITDEELKELLVKAAVIMKSMLQRFEFVANDLPLLQLGEAVDTLSNSGHLKDADDLKTQIQEVKDLRETVRRRINTKGPDSQASAPPNDFRQLSVFPEENDFQPGKKPFLRANITDGRYSDVEHYLDIQFRLLREDFIFPLRQGIRELRQEKHALENGKVLSTKRRHDVPPIYRQVRIMNPVCSQRNSVYRIQFDARRGKLRHVNWYKSKRLKYGSLICLSSDNFETLLFATVQNRDAKNLKFGELEVAFEMFGEYLNKERIREFITYRTVFEMVESDAYFEAYRYNLEAIKTLTEETMPFKEYIVSCNMDVLPPKYLCDKMKSHDEQNAERPDVHMEDEPLRALIVEEPPAVHQVLNVGVNQDRGAANCMSVQHGATTNGDDAIHKHRNDKDGLHRRDNELSNSTGTSRTTQVEYHDDKDQSRSGKQSSATMNLGEREDKTDVQRELSSSQQEINEEPSTSGSPISVFTTNHDEDNANVEGINHDKDNANVEGTNHDDDNAKKEDTNHDEGNANVEAQLVYDFTTLADSDASSVDQKDLSAVPVLQTSEWPHGEVLGLDDSQLRAFQLALTKRFALIQGPPGTGKTYVGLKIARCLLENSSMWKKNKKSPMLMISYTNHALDQFLMGILSITKNIVRVGSRSKCEELNFCSLKQVLRNCVRDDALHHISTLRYIIQQKLRKVDADHCPQEASSILEGSRRGVLSFAVLKPFMQRWHQCFDEDNTLLEWLGVTPRSKKREQQDRYTTDDFRQLLSADQYKDNDDDEFLNYARASHRDTPVLLCSIDDAKDPGKLHQNIDSDDVMEEHQERHIRDIYHLFYIERWRLYRLWRARLEKCCLVNIYECLDVYEEENAKLAEVKQSENYEVLRRAKVIGMTTTCAAKHCTLLQRLKPKVVLIEEAAEVLEAHIVTSLPVECDHVILIGDHQQLRPSTTTYRLAKDYKMNISLFERMVNSGMPCQRLSEQHRMRPEIAALMKHIYTGLQNHSSVENLPDVKGLKFNVFFLNHSYPEIDSDDSHSHINEHEAVFLVAFCRYLLQQGYGADQITILTPYLGQMFAIKDRLTETNDEAMSKIRLTSIDNFQGEESDIILLSLVRSNSDRRVGFVSDVNRACVALSRARQGLYCIGNFDLLAEKSAIWKSVIADVQGRGQLGDALPLACENHKTEITVKEPKDFENLAPSGGCTKPCEFRLECGHCCTKSCHSDDPEHREFRCIEPCSQNILSCTEGHKCPLPCWQQCEYFCREKIVKTLLCGHSAEISCYQSLDLKGVRCGERCEKFLPCNHRCQNHCSESCTKKCMELEKRTDWPCGHEVTIACSATPADCHVPCRLQLDCGHECSGTCGECRQGRVHKRCKKRCERVLVCSHVCNQTCTSTCPPCSKPCQTVCAHSKCQKKCGELCTPCAHPCGWSCAHFKCNKACGEICDRERCNIPCDRMLDCGHGLCRGLYCEDHCICIHCHTIEELFGTEEDKNTRFIRLHDCKHVIEVSGLDKWMDLVNEDDDGKVTIQAKACPRCRTIVRKSKRYNNVIKSQLLDIEKVKKTLQGDEKSLQKKKEAVMEDLLKLREPQTTRNVLSAMEDRRLHKEGRKAKVTFSILKGVDGYRLTHDEWDDLDRQIRKLSNHYAMTNLENRVTLLHQLAQLCSEVNSYLSRGPLIIKEVVFPKEILAIMREVQYFREERIMRCSRAAEARDISVEIRRLRLHLEVCRFHADITRGEHQLTSEHQDLLSEISDKMSKAVRIDESTQDDYFTKLSEARRSYPIDPLTPAEKMEIVNAIGLGRGHWFKCRQGHFYAIGECGGAMERGRCPECGDVIGGGSHRLEEGNELAREMDGAQYPAWSEQANMANYVILDED